MAADIPGLNEIHILSQYKAGTEVPASLPKRIKTSAGPLLSISHFLFNTLLRMSEKYNTFG